MGNLMGYEFSNAYNLYFNPDITPHPLEEPTFDPSLGFSHPRVERVMHATESEMVSAKMPLIDRDYCAHHLLQFYRCRKDVWPWAVRCQHEKHEYLNCRYEDHVIRMKEYERERRIRQKFKDFKDADDREGRYDEHYKSDGYGGHYERDHNEREDERGHEKDGHQKRDYHDSDHHEDENRRRVQRKNDKGQQEEFCLDD